MRILVIGPADSPHTVRPVRSLLHRGHDVCLIGYHAGNPLAGENYKKYTWFRDPGEEPFPHSENRMKATYHLLASAFKVFKPDVVHIHWVSWHLLPCHTISPNTPIVASVWGSDINIALEETASHEYGWSATLESLNAKNLPLAKHIVIDDPTMRGKCAFAAPEVPSTLLPLGTDEFFFRPDRDNAERIVKSLDAEGAHIFTSMRVVRKNYRSDDILRAFAAAAKGENAVMVFKKFLHHPKPWMELAELAKNLGVEKQIRFTENLSPEDLRDLYFASTAVINMPVRDGFPVSFGEAGAVGADVITCWHPAYDFPLVHECFDILPDDSVQALAAAIKQRLTTPPGSISPNNKAIEMARKQFSHASYIDGLEKIYHELAGDK